MTLKRDHYTCQICGRKQSKAKGKEQKIECHHLKKGFDIAWENVIDYIYREILIDPSGLITLCPNCHNKEHSKQDALNEKN